MHRRLSKTIDYTTIDYLYVGDDEIGAIQNHVLIELRPLGPGLGAELGAAPLIELNGTTLFPLYDHRGSTTVLLSTWNYTKEIYRYDAYGNSTIYDAWHLARQTSYYNNPYQFLSKRRDNETNLTYFGRRYYAPALQRWLTPDPSGHADGPNLYTYCHNNPRTLLDLYGLEGGVDANGIFSSFLIPPSYTPSFEHTPYNVPLAHPEWGIKSCSEAELAAHPFYNFSFQDAAQPKVTGFASPTDIPRP